MLRDGRHLQSCCSTLVSTVYTQQRSSLVSTATSLPGQPPSLFHTDSLAADGLALESLVARNRRSRCFAAIVGCSCYPRLGSRHRWHCHRLHRAFATLPRTRLIRPLHRRGNHFKHFICQGCNGRSLIFRLSISMLFLVVSRAVDPAFGTPGELAKIINTKSSRERSGPRFHVTGDVWQSPKPLEFLRVFRLLSLSWICPLRGSCTILSLSRDARFWGGDPLLLFAAHDSRSIRMPSIASGD
jgi:hypothetical protein